MKPMRRLTAFALLLTCAVLAAGAALAAGGDPTIMPDKFLRQWDPVTVFFKDSVGREPGTPLDQPGDYLKITPDHPGAYTCSGRYGAAK